MRRPGFSLLEVLVAAALLGLVVVACLPMFRPSTAAARLAPDRRMADFVLSKQPVTPPNATIDRFESVAGENIRGQWVVISAPAGFAIVWRELDAPKDSGQ